ncbi:hypothetical protein JHW33_00280 [Rahnella aceris]|uniref:hypothetical protein n=1 Tax=Rahnella sp. (strain Y9602) TaxID=2703885 RepID=UPI001906B4D2|nr:hypothetical protein [Rahnella aceris]QQN35127.1 hypothetical protein JHW33_00280 [Rahnella aceris]
MADTLSDSEKVHGRLIADGDLCAECYYLIHYPGRLSLCSRLIGEERWPCAISADNDTLYCERFTDYRG